MCNGNDQETAGELATHQLLHSSLSGRRPSSAVSQGAGFRCSEPKWISYRRIFEYWDEEWGYKFLEQVSHVQEALYPKSVFAEDSLRKYIKEGLEKDEAEMKAKPYGFPAPRPHQQP